MTNTTKTTNETSWKLETVMEVTMEKKSSNKLPELPPGILPGDLKHPGISDTTGMWFEMYHATGFGWCIPTLFIRKAGARSFSQHGSDRTYAIAISGGEIVRIGLGPHVTAQVIVYVAKSRLSSLQKYIDLKKRGEDQANQIRDRISSRRAQGQIRRMRWDV